MIEYYKYRLTLAESEHFDCVVERFILPTMGEPFTDDSEPPKDHAIYPHRISGLNILKAWFRSVVLNESDKPVQKTAASLQPEYMEQLWHGTSTSAPGAEQECYSREDFEFILQFGRDSRVIGLDYSPVSDKYILTVSIGGTNTHVVKEMSDKSQFVQRAIELKTPSIKEVELLRESTKKMRDEQIRTAGVDTAERQCNSNFWIFLDIDGVIVTKESHAKFVSSQIVADRIDQMALDNIKKLMTVMSDARLVLSSSWRRKHKDVEVLTQAFNDNDISLWDHETPIVYGDKTLEILKFMEGDVFGSNDKFIIIDDEPMSTERLERWRIPTSWDTGFDCDAYHKALDLILKTDI